MSMPTKLDRGDSVYIRVKGVLTLGIVVDIGLNPRGATIYKIRNPITGKTDWFARWELFDSADEESNRA